MKKSMLAIVLCVILLSLTLSACVPTTAEEAKTKMLDKGYFIVEADANERAQMAKLLGISKLECFFRCYTEEICLPNSLVMEVYFFSDASAAKEAKEEISEFYEDQIAAGDFIFEYKGKLTYAGSTKAVNDLKS